MFGTMGISELMIILVIVLIIFGAGKLPQIGEGVGKALKGFKKEVHDIPQPEAPQVEATDAGPPQVQAPPPVQQAEAATATAPAAAAATLKPTAPYTPGPELTPGTTAALMYNMAGQPQALRSTVVQAAPSAQPVDQGQRPPTMEERAAAPSPMKRAQYPPLPPTAQQKPAAKRPSAIVNKDAVARVQAQQAALKAKAAQPSGGGVSPADMQNLGEGLGDVLRTFKQAVADVRNSVDPEMRTIQAEMDAAQKEIQQSIEAARELPAVQEDPQKPA
jgi:TatA/E family protein of Tat protein translocase